MLIPESEIDESCPIIYPLESWVCTLNPDFPAVVIGLIKLAIENVIALDEVELVLKE